MTLYAPADFAEKLRLMGDELRFVLLTSKATVVAGDAPASATPTDVEDLAVEVAASPAAKCERCWHHVADVGTIAGHEEICGRCVTNIAGEGETRQFA